MNEQRGAGAGPEADHRLRAAAELERLLDEAEAAQRVAREKRERLAAEAERHMLSLSSVESLDGVASRVRALARRIRADVEMDAAADEMLNASFDLGAESDDGPTEGAATSPPGSAPANRVWLHSPRDKRVSLKMDELESPVEGDYEAIHRASGGNRDERLRRARRARRRSSGVAGSKPPPAAPANAFRTPSPSFPSPPNARGRGRGPGSDPLCAADGSAPSAQAADAAPPEGEGPHRGGDASPGSVASAAVIDRAEVARALAAATAAGRNLAEALDSAGGEVEQ